MTTPVPPTTPTGAPESPAQETRAKIDRPHARFQQPTDVVVDPALSKPEKVRVLDKLEQDARQLAAASDEGMSGGEATGLHEVLAAKGALDLPPADIAAALLTQSLKSHLAGIEGTAEHTVIAHAIDAIKAATAAIAHLATAGPTPEPNAPTQSKGQVAAEVAAEAALEKLDP